LDAVGNDLIPLDGRRRVLVPRIGGDGPFASFAVSPDGRLIAYQPPNGRKTMVVARLGERGGECTRSASSCRGGIRTCGNTED
jgi:hypothetical protein